MSTTIRVDLKRLGATLIKHEGMRTEAIRRGMAAGADRGVGLLVRKSKAVVYMGQFQNSWHIPMRRDRNVVTVRNDAPHAGIIEAGARPHGVNAEGRAALLEWVLRVIAPQTAGPTTSFANKGALSNARKVARGGIDALGKRAKLGTFIGAAVVLKEAQGIVWAICQRIKSQGVKGHWIVRDNLEVLAAYSRAEVGREIRQAAGAMAAAQAFSSLGGGG